MGHDIEFCAVTTEPMDVSTAVVVGDDTSVIVVERNPTVGAVTGSTKGTSEGCDSAVVEVPHGKAEAGAKLGYATEGATGGEVELLSERSTFSKPSKGEAGTPADLGPRTGREMPTVRDGSFTKPEKLVLGSCGGVRAGPR